MLSKVWGNLELIIPLIRRYSSKRHSSFLDYHIKLSHCHVDVTATTVGADLGSWHTSMKKFVLEKVFKSEPSKICERQPLKSLMVWLNRPYLFKFFKGCLPQILLGPLEYFVPFVPLPCEERKT